MRSGLFVCPVCGKGLSLGEDGHCLHCDNRHSFDIARQGYVSLITGAGPRGDTTTMVSARASFLASGAYTPIADALADLAKTILEQARPERTQAVSEAEVICSPRPHRCDTGTRPVRSLIADLGGGTGWYSAHLLDRLPTCDGVLLDASTPAARRAARAHPRLSVATADLWRSIPLPSGSCDMAMVVFAPRNPAEIARILARGGTCVVVTPRPEHLRELTDQMLTIEPEKQTRLSEQFATFSSHEKHPVTFHVTLGQAEIAAIIAMGPTAFHTSPEDIESHAAQVKELTVTVAVDIHAFRGPPAL